MVTLHGYILRELLKSFGLTVVALSALFTMGGMLFTVMRYEGVTTNDLFRVAPMLLPIILTLVMPISALFAATMSYGRLASDNEFVACRAAGINVHRLFLPALLLAFGVAIFTLFSINAIIPQFMQQIIYYGRTNVRDIAFNQMRQRGFINFNKKDNRYILTAKGVQDVTEGALVERGFEPPDRSMRYFWIDEPTFLWIDSDERLKRFAAADGGLCMFDTRGGEVKLTVYVKNVLDFDVTNPQAVSVNDQPIGPVVVPRRFPLKPAMVDLSTLLQWRKEPWVAPEIGGEVHDFMLGMQRYKLYKQLAEQVSNGQKLTFTDDYGRQYELTARSVERGDKAPLLHYATLVRHDPGETLPMRIEAPRAELSIAPDAEGTLLAEIKLEHEGGSPVLQFNPRSGDPTVPLRTEAFTAANLLLPDALLADITADTPEQILTGTLGDTLNIDEAIVPALDKIRADADKLRRKVISLIHFRLSFAISALVTVLMGAVLGVMFRGSRALAAFGLACIPLGASLLMILVGRQLVESESVQWIGATVIWGGLAAIGLTDAVLMRLGVAR